CRPRDPHRHGGFRRPRRRGAGPEPRTSGPELHGADQSVGGGLRADRPAPLPSAPRRGGGNRDGSLRRLVGERSRSWTPPGHAPAIDARDAARYKPYSLSDTRRGEISEESAEVPSD